MSFNLLDYLSSRNIAYKTEGKNIGREDVGIKCLFCDDPSYHLNIHKTIGMWRCLICGEKGGIFHLVKVIEPEGTRIKDILADYFDYEYEEKKKKEGLKIDIEQLYDIGIEGAQLKSNIFLPLLAEWMEERGFNLNDLYRWRGLLPISYNDYFAYRLVVPMADTKGEEWVCAVGRDLTEKANIRYLPAPNGSMRKNYQACLYNDWEVRKEKTREKRGLILVEGIFDVWRLEKLHWLSNYGVVGTNGKVLSKEQEELIRQIVNWKDLMEVVICLDGGSKKETKEFVSLISSYHRNISVVDLPENEDPDSLGLKGQFEYYFYRRQRVV